MTPPPDLIRLARFIEQEAGLLQQFLTALGEEQQLLVDGRTDALLTLASTKTELYRGLQRIHDDRAILLARLGLQNTEPVIRGLLEKAPQALARWDAVLDLARQAQAQNAINGRLITERMQSNQAALAVLLSAADRPQLYGADGRARASSGGRHLGSA